MEKNRTQISTTNCNATTTQNTKRYSCLEASVQQTSMLWFRRWRELHAFLHWTPIVTNKDGRNEDSFQKSIHAAIEIQTANYFPSNEWKQIEVPYYYGRK